MGQHGYTVRSNPFFIVHRGKTNFCYLQCIDTMLIRSDSTEGYFILIFGIEKSLIISLMMELFLYNLGWYSLSFAYSIFRISSIITHLKDRIHLGSKANKFCDYSFITLILKQTRGFIIRLMVYRIITKVELISHIYEV